MTLSSLLHRLRRHRSTASQPQPPTASSSADLAASATAARSFTSIASSVAGATVVSPTLPIDVLLKCLDYVDNPFTLGRLRRVNRSFRDYVDARFASIVEIDVRRSSFDALSTTSAASSSFSSVVDCAAPLVTLGDRTWHCHPNGYKLLVRVEGSSRLEMLVDEEWTSREVQMIGGALNLFRRHVTHIYLDAPIIELVGANFRLAAFLSFVVGS